jgi:plastocyanin
MNQRASATGGVKTMNLGRRRLGTLMGLLVAPLVALALGLGPGNTAAQGGAAVSIVDFAFQPASIEVPVGSTVTWTNTGAVPHTVTSDSGAFDSGQLSPGASFSQTFDTAGTFTYHCSIHPQMTGTVVVTGGQVAPAGEQTAASQTTQMPRTGTGNMTPAHNQTLAILAGALAMLFAIGAHLAYRRI